MKRTDSIIEAIIQHEVKIIGSMICFFIWIVIQIFSLKEAQAVQQTNLEYIKEKVDSIYELVK